MASEQPVGAGAASSPGRPARAGERPEARPFYSDPLRIAGWGVTLLALASYWWLFVRRPAPAPGQQIARLTAVEGRVRVKPNAREAWTEARLSALLHVGDVVQTEARAGAVISFDTGSVVRVRPESIVFVGGSAESSTAAWRVSSGRVNFAVGGRDAEILTPQARARALANAAGQIDVSDSGTGLKIFRGQAELETRLGQTISLVENQAVQVDASGRAGERQLLPPPPVPLAPATRAALPFVAPPLAVTTLAWTAAPRAATYRVAMDFNVTQADLLLSAALDVPGIDATTHPLSGVDPGRYFWRVAGVTADGLEGAFSRVSLFSVLRPSPPPPAASPSPPPAPALELQELERVSGGVLHVSGRADPGAALTVNGTRVSVMPDGSFSEYLKLGASGEVLVRSTARDGRTTEQRRPVPGR
jgi:hypothetical protein